MHRRGLQSHGHCRLGRFKQQGHDNGCELGRRPRAGHLRQLNEQEDFLFDDDRRYAALHDSNAWRRGQADADGPLRVRRHRPAGEFHSHYLDEVAQQARLRRDDHEERLHHVQAVRRGGDAQLEIPLQDLELLRDPFETLRHRHGLNFQDELPEVLRMQPAQELQGCGGESGSERAVRAVGIVRHRDRRNAGSGAHALFHVPPDQSGAQELLERTRGKRLAVNLAVDVCQGRAQGLEAGVRKQGASGAGPVRRGDLVQAVRACSRLIRLQGRRRRGVVLLFVRTMPDVFRVTKLGQECGQAWHRHHVRFDFRKVELRKAGVANGDHLVAAAIHVETERRHEEHAEVGRTLSNNGKNLLAEIGFPADADYRGGR